MRAKRILFIIAISLCIFGSNAQNHNADSLEQIVDEQYGLEKLKVINQLTELYFKSQEKDKYKYGRKGLDLAENLLNAPDDHQFQETDPFIAAYYYGALLEYEKEHYFNAKLYFEQSMALSKAFQSNLFQKESQLYLDSIDAMIEREEIKENKLLNKLNNLKVGKIIKDASLDFSIKSEIKFAESKEKSGNIGGAITNYKEAINLSRNKGDFSTVKKLQLKVSELLQELNRQEEAQQFLAEAIEEGESSATKPKKDTLSQSLRELKNIADSLARSKNTKESRLYYQLYNELSRRLKEDSIQAEIQAQQKQQEILLLKQQKEIADLTIASSQQAKEREHQEKNILIIIASLILIASFIIYYFYLAKRKQHTALNKAHNDLVQTKNNLEQAEKKIVRLLKQQVSQDIADKLLVDTSDQKAERHFVSIMFLDIRNFTVHAEKMSPEELIAFQNQVFGFMIDCVEEHHGNINQFLGDGFMASFGAPISHGNDCENAFQSAKKIINKLELLILEKKLPPIRIGIGLHAGFIVSGNVGNKNRMQYSITGNPVIIASRIEQLNKQFDSQFIISETLYQHLEKKSQKEIEKAFEEVQLKGRTERINILVVE